QAYRQAWSADQAMVFGSQAGTDDYKGWMDLVHAVASLPEDLRARVRIALAGALPTDRQREEVRQAGMADQVFFTGPLDDVRPFLAAIDVGFVLSWRVETISFACREMMSMGVPVVVSDHGGLPENIASGTDGWIVPRRDIAAIARCVQQIVDAPQTVAQIGQAARSRAQNTFGIDRFVSATEAVYQKLVTGKR
ncbi:MAG: glycosyltransferase, partial [Comamonadaceae bacterium]